MVSSTGAHNLAYASREGAFFSDYFISALRQGKSLYASYAVARAATLTGTGGFQTPWLDDNGDGKPDTTFGGWNDGQEAHQRVLTDGEEGTELWPPYIEQVEPPEYLFHQSGSIRARVLDDGSVERVWAVISPPSYEPPQADEQLAQVALPTIVLLEAEHNWYTAAYYDFDEAGVYRVVIYALDRDGLEGQPVTLDLPVPPGGDAPQEAIQVYLPLVRQ